jgi:hypothetical protein
MVNHPGMMMPPPPPPPPQNYPMMDGLLPGPYHAMPGFPGYAAPSMDQMYSYQMSAPGRQNQPQNAPALLLPHHQMALPSMPASYPGPGGSYHLPNSMSSASTDLDSIITSTERLSFGSGSQHRQQQSGSQFISASSSTSDSPEKVSPTHGYSSHSGDAYHHNHHHHQYPQHQVKENNFTRQQQNGYPPNKQHYSNNSANYLAANNNVPVALNVPADAKNYNYF